MKTRSLKQPLDAHQTLQPPHRPYSLRLGSLSSLYQFHTSCKAYQASHLIKFEQFFRERHAPALQQRVIALQSVVKNMRLNLMAAKSYARAASSSVLKLPNSRRLPPT
jgi:hypothetical protein